MPIANLVNCDAKKSEDVLRILNRKQCTHLLNLLAVVWPERGCSEAPRTTFNHGVMEYRVKKLRIRKSHFKLS